MRYKRFSYPNPVFLSDLHKCARTRFTDWQELGPFFDDWHVPLNAWGDHEISHLEHQFLLGFSEETLTREILVLPLPSWAFWFLYSTDFSQNWIWSDVVVQAFWKRRALFDGRKMEIFLPRLIHIQSSQNVNHKRSSIRCIKDQCQSDGKGHRTNRRDQLPQLCWLPNWERVIPVSGGAQPEPGACSSDQLTSPCPLQSHSKK